MLKKPSSPSQGTTLEGEEDFACTYSTLVQDLRIWTVQQLMECSGLAEKHLQAARNARSHGEEPPSTGALGQAIYIHKLCKQNLLELRKFISQAFLMLEKQAFSVEALEAADLVLNNLAVTFVNSKTLIDPNWLLSKVAKPS